MEHNEKDARLSIDLYLQRCNGIADDDFPEDPYPMPQITIEEAYDFGLVEQDAHLFVYWSGEFDSEEYPPARRVQGIERDRTPISSGKDAGRYGYLVHAGELMNSCGPDERLTIGASTLNERLLWGAWMRKDGELFKVEQERNELRDVAEKLLKIADACEQQGKSLHELTGQIAYVGERPMFELLEQARATIKT